MMKKYKNLLIISLVLFLSKGYAQELKLEEAISIGLSNNHSITIANKQNEATQKDIHFGAVGYLPKVDLTGSASYSDNISNQEFATNAFPAVEDMQAASTGTSAQVSASYMIFNGFGRARTYAKLKEGGVSSDLQTKISIEGTLVQIVNSYYDVVKKSEQLNLIEESMSISADRLKRVQTKFEYGSIGKLEILNAQVDFNNDSANYINSELALTQSKRQLNFLLGRGVETEFSVTGDMKFIELKTIEEYKEKAKSNNTSIVLSEVALNMAEIDRKINQSNFMPTISTKVNYGYQGSSNEVGVVQKSSSIGYTAAVSLSWNLFDGMKRKKALEKAKILIDVNATKKEQAVLNVEMEIVNYYDALSTYLKLIELENSNLKVAELNLERSKELFYNGTITNLQFRQAQLNLLQTQNKINNYKYAVKIYEYQILRLTGELVK